MKQKLLELLACPSCGNALEMKAISRQGSEIMTGILTCSCAEWYPIIGGVPRMASGSLRPDYPDFIKKYRSYIPSNARKTQKKTEGNEKKIRTSRSFGFEWKSFPDFGWRNMGSGTIDTASHSSVIREDEWAHTVDTFWRKTLLTRKELNGSLVLDVGAGNGRYAAVANRSGAEVVGLDLSEAVDVAFKNTRNMKGIHIVQADIFHPPFKAGIFDFIYSIGVLHHTPNTRRAFQSLLPFLKKGGKISIHLYHKGNIIYEINDRLIRAFTTRMPLPKLWALCRIPTFIGKSFFKSRCLFAALNALARVHAHHHFNFDWYSAPVACHHREDEVRAWFRHEGMGDITGDDPREHSDSYFSRIYPGWARNRDGTVKGWVASLVPRWALTVRGTK